MQIVECVPNFSEGRNKATLDAIAEAIRAVEGVLLLDVDPGADTNRTVVTFVGPPEGVLEAAFRAIAKAAERIDMRTHKGAHARLGATDVCPFVPVRGLGLEECAALAERLGARVAAELGIPVYLYEAAARKPERRNLATVRAGEYEGLPEKLRDPAWAPDFGPAEFNQKSGATVIGAREFLIAYNFNLNTRDRGIAQDIALEIREAGRALRGPDGAILRDERGEPRNKPGRFKYVKAVGWTMESFGCAQVSMNLTNFHKTPLAEVFDEVCRLAEQRGVRCTGSELVGLIPEEALLEAGRHYLQKAGKSAGASRTELVRLAVQSLGLSELYPFKPDEKIIERRLKVPRPLAEAPVMHFVDRVASEAPAPGGGSVAALCGALSAALSSMAANLTVGRRGFEAVAEEMKQLAERAQAVLELLVAAVDDDTAAFNAIVAANRLPGKTEQEQAVRAEARQAATRQAIAVPMQVLESAGEALSFAEATVARANPAALSDAGVAGLCARAAAEGAAYNVLINLRDLTDASERNALRAKTESLLEDALRRADALSAKVRDGL